MSKLLSIIGLICLFFLISGCGVKQPVLSKAEKCYGYGNCDGDDINLAKDSPLSDQEIKDITIMGLPLIPNSVKADMGLKYSNYDPSEFEINDKPNDSAGNHVVMGIAENAVSSAAGSVAGARIAGLDLGLSILGSLTGSGKKIPPDEFSMQYIMVAIPDTIKEVTDTASAEVFVKKYVIGKLKEWAKDYNRAVECIAHCDESNATYEIRYEKTEIKPYFNPMVARFTFYSSNKIKFSKIKDEVKNRDINRILGFNSSYEEMIGVFYDLCLRSDKEEVKIRNSGEPVCGMSNFNNPLYRELLRYITSDGYISIGSAANDYSHIFALKGKIYNIYVNFGQTENISKDHFIKFEYDREKDLKILKTQ